MRQFILILAIMVLSMGVNAQTPHKTKCQEEKTEKMSRDPRTSAEADRILGTWLIDTKEGKIEIFKRDGKYFGKIVWLKEPYAKDGSPKKDIHNPEPSLRSRKIIGLEVMSNLEYKNGEWVNGTLYAVRRGEYVNCTLKMEDNGDKLKVTIKKDWFTRSRIWTRVKKEKK